jgi:hypothetical protein
MGTNRREFILVAAAVLCVGGLLADKFVATPLFGLWTARSEAITVLQQNLDEGEILMEREELVRQRWTDMGERTLSSDISVAENRILTAVNRWSRSSLLDIATLKPRWSPRGEEFKTLEYRATGRGDLSAVTRFLFELEQDPIALRVEDVAIVTRDDRGRELTLDVRFTVLISTDENS